MESGFSIKILARKTEVVGDGGQLDLGLAVGEVGGLPDRGAGGGDQLLRGAEVVVKEEIGAGILFVLPQADGLVVQVKIVA